MQQNFARALALVLASEGGKVDDKLDPGGRTNEGVTQATFNAWLTHHGKPHRDVFTITAIEVEAIYRLNYWNAIDGDNLPAGIDLATFDYAVNSGVSRAAISLQEAVGTAPDGKIGPLTLAAIKHGSPRPLITKLCAMRLHFLQQLSGWPHFGAGWHTRVNTVEAAALKLAA